MTTRTWKLLAACVVLWAFPVTAQQADETDEIEETNESDDADAQTDEQPEPPDPRGTAPADASSPNEVAQPDETPTEEDMDLETATPDPNPIVPSVLQRPEANLDVVEQAGVGGPTAFASAGVLEVGGTGTLHLTGEATSLSIAPFVGWFVYDGIQLSLIHEIRANFRPGGRTLSSLVILEISVHLRIQDRLLAFIGVGPGVFYKDKVAFALKGRLGLDVMVGRSGIFRPALFITYATEHLVDPFDAFEGDHYALGVEITYSAMF